jgi:hypothetical protein
VDRSRMEWLGGEEARGEEAQGKEAGGGTGAASRAGMQRMQLVCTMPAGHGAREGADGFVRRLTCVRIIPEKEGKEAAKHPAPFRGRAPDF